VCYRKIPLAYEESSVAQCKIEFCVEFKATPTNILFRIAQVWQCFKMLLIILVTTLQYSADGRTAWLDVGQQPGLVMPLFPLCFKWFKVHCIVLVTVFI